MATTRRNDEAEETHKTMPAFGGTDADRTSGIEEEPAYENVSPLPISTPSAEGVDELPSVIKPGVELLHNKYRVIRELGRGGMGSVWLVEHKELGQKRALKLIHDNYAADKQVRKRFRREAQILASLRHPNAVLVYDYDFIGKVPYIDMEYLKGEALRKRLKPGVPLSISWILWVLQELQKVLDQAHALKIVHRDLKPENIMVVEDPLSGREELKVLDFGIAKIVQQASDENTSLTMDTQGLLGTLAYASPEQNELNPDKAPPVVDHRSDIYSVGVMLFEMLTGKRPFLGGQAQLLFQHAEVPPPSFQKVAPTLSLPPAVELVVRRCLEKNPEARPNSMAELLGEFRHAIGQSETHVASTAPGPRTTPPVLSTNGRNVATEQATAATGVPQKGGRKRLPARLGVVAAVLAGGLVIAAVMALLWKPKPPPPRPPEIPAAVREFLARREFQPVQGSELADGWPAALWKSGRETRNWRLHGKVYLPEGYEPELETDDHGLPLVVKSPEGVRFVLLPGGTFKMGAFDESPAFSESERPGHQVTLSTFYMQEAETTIGQFDRYRERFKPGDHDFDVYGQLRDALAGSVDNKEDLASYPAAGVSYRHATQYAQSIGAELPSEAQWEYAARSCHQPWLYVWGNTVNDGTRRANLLGVSGTTVWQVGTAKGDRTDQGVLDLAGNVREWCRDVWRTYRPDGPFIDPVEVPSPGQADPKFVIRGGSYQLPEDFARTTCRKGSGLTAYEASIDDCIEDVGFRTVIEVLVTEDLTPHEAPGAAKRQEHAR